MERVAAPGATIIIVTGCHRDLSPDEDSLKPDEKKLLDKICASFHLGEWCSAADYTKMLQSLKLQVKSFYLFLIQSLKTHSILVTVFQSENLHP